MTGEIAQSYVRRTRDRATRFTVRAAGRRLRPLVNRAATLPVVGRGFEVAPPDFVGVGVQRAGTSWWHGLIESHPGVYPLGLAAKELHFFDARWRTGLDADAGRAYHRQFTRPPGTLGGEWTPRYMYDPWTPALLHAAAPDARLLVMLRDPVARLRSGLQHAAERNTPITADVAADAIARGRYWDQLHGLLACVPREQVLVLQYERCRSHPVTQLRATYEFLGLAPDPHADLVASTPGGAVNASVGAPIRIATELVDAATRVYQPDLERLARDFPEIDLDLWPTAAR